VCARFFRSKAAEDASSAVLTNRVDDEFVSGPSESVAVVRIDAFGSGNRSQAASSSSAVEADQTASVLVSVRRPHFVAVRFDAPFLRSLLNSPFTWHSVPVGSTLTVFGELYDADGERLHAVAPSHARVSVRTNRADLLRVSRQDGRTFELFVARSGVTILRFAVFEQPSVRPCFVVIVARTWLQLVSVPGSAGLLSGEQSM
jgi:hypothetical protein